MLYSIPFPARTPRTMTAAAMAFTNDFRQPFPLAVHIPPARTRVASASSTTPLNRDPSRSSQSIDSSRTQLDTSLPSIAMPHSKNSVDIRPPCHSTDGCSDRDHQSVPPPYTHSVEPPSYTADPPPLPSSEPRTLPMYMFILGFVCPLFWLIGAFMLRPPHAHRRGAFDPYASLPEAEKAAAEREAERQMRRWEVEMRWAKRCMWAAVVFACVGLAVGMSVWGVVEARARRNGRPEGALS
ncbi:hypothetical protein LshimejAT787_0800160 [Lyophyllum shimeji]|uniref:Transmembrane protein n=1 Tax=Lyophyllum shimeji TaxID=47721 RepID=A0A9P3PQF8_LYOSH|nr:hypothetical protein LshimejAT787_0800160 [Lyophyllum shimeji]